MTDQQKQRIINLRAEGKQSKEIAEELGLSLGCVNMFMSRRKREGEWRKCEMCGGCVSTSVSVLYQDIGKSVEG